MTDILIRNLDKSVDKALKQRALEHGRTREAEIKLILEAAVRPELRKRSFAEALMDIPKVGAHVDDLFKRSDSPARTAD